MKSKFRNEKESDFFVLYLKSILCIIYYPFFNPSRLGFGDSQLTNFDWICDMYEVSAFFLIGTRYNMNKQKRRRGSI